MDGLCLVTGMTKTMLERLRSRPMLVKMKGGIKPVLKQIGGPEVVTDEIIDRCLGRMAARCKLGEEISTAEFPGPSWRLKACQCCGCVPSIIYFFVACVFVVLLHLYLVASFFRFLG